MKRSLSRFTSGARPVMVCTVVSLAAWVLVTSSGCSSSDGDKASPGGASGSAGSAGSSGSAGTAGSGGSSGSGGTAGTGGTTGTGGSPPTGDCQAPRAAITNRCVSVAQDAWGTHPYSCKEPVKMLIAGVYPSDRNPTATLAELKAMIDQPGYRGHLSFTEYLVASTGGMLTPQFDVITLELPKTWQAYKDDAGKNDLLEDDAYQAIKDSGYDLSKLTRNAASTQIPYALGIVGLMEHTHNAVASVGYNSMFSGNHLSWFNDVTKGDLGVITHEAGHAYFGFGEFYGDFNNRAISAWGAMSNGYQTPYNPFLRQCRQWAYVVDIADGAFPEGTVFRLPSNNNVAVRWRTKASPEEYFLIEAVQKKGSYGRAPGEGLLIWHVDETQKWQHTDDTPEKHLLLELEQADGKRDLENGDFFGDATDPFYAGNNDSFGSDTKPNSRYWKGGDSGLHISEITAPGATMEFKLGAPSVPRGKTVDLVGCKVTCPSEGLL